VTLKVTAIHYIRTEISFEYYRWHWTNSVFFWALSCSIYRCAWYLALQVHGSASSTLCGCDVLWYRCVCYLAPLQVHGSVSLTLCGCDVRPRTSLNQSRWRVYQHISLLWFCGPTWQQIYDWINFILSWSSNHLFLLPQSSTLVGSDSDVQDQCFEFQGKDTCTITFWVQSVTYSTKISVIKIMFIICSKQLSKQVTLNVCGCLPCGECV